MKSGLGSRQSSKICAVILLFLIEQSAMAEMLPAEYVAHFDCWSQIHGLRANDSPPTSVDHPLGNVPMNLLQQDPKRPDTWLLFDREHILRIKRPRASQCADSCFLTVVLNRRNASNRDGVGDVIHVRYRAPKSQPARLESMTIVPSTSAGTSGQQPIEASSEDAFDSNDPTAQTQFLVQVVNELHQLPAEFKKRQERYRRQQNRIWQKGDVLERNPPNYQEYRGNAQACKDNPNSNLSDAPDAALHGLLPFAPRSTVGNSPPNNENGLNLNAK